jgi:hypothetical protein
MHGRVYDICSGFSGLDPEMEAKYRQVWFTNPPSPRCDPPEMPPPRTVIQVSILSPQHPDWPKPREVTVLFEHKMT